ncbi:hypothetical protein [Psychromicrobium lacuslunae]|uniref:Beta-carotene 15,15'-monooxygenase n=1 Tax=Psychromicrobium lacuslunae TaxID=1618207 RepID=A0A0D4BWV2_9MICC|nr:hypothetical protein [Psychromicrobium lacuslunae]AJT40581.1 hypothetical protein UM93_01785 [Psychromicrobium lacuslunae]
MKRQGAEHEDEAVSIADALRGAWENLPLLLLQSVLACLGFGLVVFALPGLTPLSVLLGMALLAPVFASMIHTALSIIDGDDPRVRDWLFSFRRGWSRSLGQALCCAVPIALTLVAWQALNSAAQLWLYLPVVVGGSVSVIIVLALPIVFALNAELPARAASNSGQAEASRPGVEKWLLACHLLARRPIPFLAVAALAVLGIWLAANLSAALMLLLPVPVALVAALAYRTVLAQLNIHQTTTAGAAQ